MPLKFYVTSTLKTYDIPAFQRVNLLYSIHIKKNSGSKTLQIYDVNTLLSNCLPLTGVKLSQQ